LVLSRILRQWADVQYRQASQQRNGATAQTAHGPA